ncbi:MAG: hypothetical protein ACRC33_24065 [Gemmataceae bacterium]
MVRWLVQFVLPLAAASAALGLVIGLGWWLRPAAPPARVSFADIACDAPPGMTREKFLEEVQSRSGLPDAVDPRDEAAGTAVRAAFKAHPWVKLVSPVERRAGGVSVALVYRRPVLLVAAWGHPVDEEGVILPKVADPSALLVDRVKRGVPSASQGQRCAEVADLAAAAGRLSLPGAELVLEKDDLVLKGERFVVRVRRGEEGKVADAGPLDGFEWDLRGAVKKKPVR